MFFLVSSLNRIKAKLTLIKIYEKNVYFYSNLKKQDISYQDRIKIINAKSISTR